MQGNQDLSSFRFHITETVFIPNDKPAVEQIEEIELIPEIEVFIKEDEIRIAGNLALYGEYRGKRKLSMTEHEKYLQESDPATHFPPFEAEDSAFSPWRKSGEIYHRIPVSITLPKEKIPDTGEIFAIVDAFDYDIKSSHQLLITAELVLTGIRDQMEISAESTKVGDESQFFTVAGEGGNPLDEEDEVDSWDYFLKSEKQRQQSVREEESEKSKVESSVSEQDDVDDDGVEKVEQEQSDSAESAFKSDGDAGEEEKEELVRNEAEQKLAEVKIGFKPKASKQEEKPIDLKSVFDHATVESSVAVSESGWESKIEQSTVGWTKEEERDMELADGVDRSEDQEEKQAEESRSGEDARYLTNFMKNREELFTRLTMCIVQKEENLSAIAQRYEVPVDMLMQYNRLDSDILEEGQLLYIPKSNREKEE